MLRAVVVCGLWSSALCVREVVVRGGIDAPLLTLLLLLPTTAPPLLFHPRHAIAVDVVAFSFSSAQFVWSFWRWYCGVSPVIELGGACCAFWHFSSTTTPASHTNTTTDIFSRPSTIIRYLYHPPHTFHASPIFCSFMLAR